MSDSLFDRSREYDQMLTMGLRYSGEDKRYFMVGRIRDLSAQLPATFTVRRILDFGCGIGDTSAHLAEVFPEATIVGVDTSERSLEYARTAFPSDRLRFENVTALAGLDPFDLCYTNGVFHHIRPEDRLESVRLIHRALRPAGCFALFENNPWNPGTRLIMSRIPFDRDAQRVAPREALKLLLQGGFSTCAPSRFLFYFPAPLAFLRFAEPWLVHVPMGAQYYILATK